MRRILRKSAACHVLSFHQALVASTSIRESDLWEEQIHSLFTSTQFLASLLEYFGHSWGYADSPSLPKSENAFPIHPPLPQCRHVSLGTSRYFSNPEGDEGEIM